MSGGLVDASGRTTRERRLPRPRTGEAMASEPLEMVASLMGSDVGAIGLGAAGLVSHSEGMLLWGPNVPGEHIPFRDLLHDAFGVPVAVDNDANLAALAEVRNGAARGFRHVLMLTLGTGIGGGIVIDGEVYRGAAFAGEVGHMVVDVGGPRCTCGQDGCLETFASGRRLDQLARDGVAADPEGKIARLAGGSSPSGVHLTEAAVQGDPTARAMLDEVGGWLGVGIASLVAVLDPEIVVVGGAASRGGDLLLDPARRRVAACLEGAGRRRPPPLVSAALGADSGWIGAGLAAWELLDG